MGDVIRITCWATVKQDMPDGTVLERRCKNAPLPGQKVCRLHGGATPGGQRAGAERVANAEIRTALSKFGVPVMEDPKTVLLRTLAVAHGNVLVLESMVQEYDAASLHDEDQDVRAKIRSTLHLLAEWQDRAATFAALALKNGVEERMVQATEWQTVALVAALREVLNEHLEPDKREAVLADLSRRMRLLAAG